MKKLAILIATLLIVCLMACACGTVEETSTPDSSTETSSTQGTTSTPTSEAPTSQAPTSQGSGNNTTPPASGQSYVLDTATLTAGKLSAPTVVGIYTITNVGSSSKEVEIATTNSSAPDGSKFTMLIKTQGKMDVATFAKCIKIEAPSAGTLTWYAKSGSSTSADATTRTVDLLDANGTRVGGTDAGIDSAKCDQGTITIPAAGTYYFGSLVNGISVYGLKFVG